MEKMENGKSIKYKARLTDSAKFMASNNCKFDKIYRGWIKTISTL